ncbi:MAG: YcxB family protein [Christensenellaceae bacterium]|nr:YcxB family protein [Christensenellaceae bacterium]
MKDTIIAVSRIDAKTFRRFAYFDTYRLKKRYRAPLGFLALMLVFSLCCIFLAADKPQARMIGVVLLAVGLLLPLAYFLTFELSVRTQTREMKQPRKVYTLTLGDELQISAANGKEQVKLPWNKVYGAYRLPGCIYLYAHPTKAFLLPDGQASVAPDEVFAFLQTHIGEKRTQDCRLSKAAPIVPDDHSMR